MAYRVISKNHLNILMAPVVAFFKIPFALSALVFSNNLALYIKDLKLLVLAISALKLVASSFEQNHKLSVVLE